MTQRENNSEINARYRAIPYDIMIIGPKGAQASFGDDDDKQPILWCCEKPSCEMPIFAEILNWSEHTPLEQEEILNRISFIKGWDLSLLRLLVKKAEQNPSY